MAGPRYGSILIPAWKRRKRAQRLCGAELQFLAIAWTAACDAGDYEQLGGGQFTGGGGSPLVKWPNPEEEWAIPGSGHIDAYGPGGWSPFMLGQQPTFMMSNPAAVGSFFGPEVTIQPTSTSFNIRSQIGWQFLRY